VYKAMTAHPTPRRASYGNEISLAVRALLRAGRHMQAAMGRRLDLGETDLNAMDELVAAGEPIGPVELGNRLGIRSASATVLVDRLEAAGHLNRERHPNDRRRITLYTTESARQEVRATLEPMIQAINTITRRLDEGQAQTVLAFLADVTEAMYAFASDPGPQGPPARSRAPKASG
jgi:DNA-binding MarR family transcriptional regulator